MTERLSNFITNRLQDKPILVMSHAVLGFPSIESNHRSTSAFSDAGIDMIELQFPYSDPMADGPILLNANQKAVASGISVDQCFKESEAITANNPNTAFLIMTYLNIIYARGYNKFAAEAAKAGIYGVIIPDLPVEEAHEWREACRNHGIAPIFMVTPDTTDSRMKQIVESSRGFLYCVARKGITGKQTTFDREFFEYIDRVKGTTDLPLGVGFGIRNKEDIDALTGKISIGIVCSKAIELIHKESVESATSFLKNLRSP